MSNLHQHLEKLADKTEKIIIEINKRRIQEAANIEKANDPKSRKAKKVSKPTLSASIYHEANIISKNSPRSKYVHWLCKNMIVDFAQLRYFDEVMQNELQRFKLDPIAIPYYKNSFNNLKFDSNHHLAQALDTIDRHKPSGMNERRLHKIYRFIVDMHLYSSKKFKKEKVKTYSEADFIIKFWGYIFESFFVETEFDTYWGDTLNEACKKEGLSLKLYFRLAIFSLSSSYDTATGEFAKKATATKQFGDKLKSIIATKGVINSMVKDCSLSSFEQITKLKFPIIQVMGFEAVVSVVRLVSPKLYTVHKVHEMNFPVNCKDLCLNKIGRIYEGLLMIENLASDIKRAIEDTEIYEIPSKMDSIKKGVKIKKVKSCNWTTKLRWFDEEEFEEEEDDEDEDEDED
ncbi:hypothetical protein INT47_009034 [Mucor saturninus]|uniref:Uncharacterized protein n=1 Tax=Mucor saturninus TaxID=64648 RepID=A0A8H7RP99_9FUNG|nr:hypothetical protein INT47_009034 [Mucor saturninus]